MLSTKLFKRSIPAPPATDIPKVQEITQCSNYPGAKPYTKKITNYIYTADSEENVLIITAFCGEWRWRLFVGKDDYVLQRAENPSKGFTACLDKLCEYYNCYHPINGADEFISAFFSARRWYVAPKRYYYSYTEGFKLILGWQERQRSRHLEDKHDKIRRSLNDKMLEVKPLPRALCKWAYKKAVTHNLIYKSKGRMGYCTACGAEVIAPKGKHNAAVKCPHCHERVICRCDGRYRDGAKLDTFGRCWYIQPRKSGCIARLVDVRVIVLKGDMSKWYTDFEFKAAWGDWSIGFAIYECGRYFIGASGEIDSGGAIEWRTRTNQYRAYDAGAGMEWMLSRNCVNFREPIYASNLGAIAAKYPAIKYMPLAKMAKYGTANPIELLKMCIRRPWMEYVVKMGLDNMAKDIVCGNINVMYGIADTFDNDGATIYDVLKIPKARLKELINLNPDVSGLRLFQSVCQNPRVKNVAEVILTAKAFADKYGVHMSDFEMPLKYGNIGKVIAYVTEQATKRHEDGYARDMRDAVRYALSDYGDYLNDAEADGLNMEDTAVIRPYDLHEAHTGVETAREIARYIKAGEPFAEMLANTAVGLTWLADEDDEYIIRPIATFDELINESRLMQHCVGGYAERYAKGQTIICALRRKADPSKPYVTIELQADFKRIIQARGFKNSTPADEAKAFYTKWINKVIKKAAKTA